MAIRQKKYIDITSGVGGSSAVKNREYTARCFTTNELVGVGHVLFFNDADAVMERFGSSSHEYKFAAKYFGFIAKNITQAKRISFARWSPTASNAYILSTTQAETDITKLKGSNGKISLSIGASSVVVEPELTAASSLADVITALQTKLQSIEGYSTSTVTISNGHVKIVVGQTNGEIHPCQPLAYEAGSSDLATLLGLVNGTICSNYNAGESCAEACSRVDAISDNCGSIIFLNYAISEDEAKAVVTWNETKNYKYLLIVAKKAYTNGVGTLEDTGSIISFANAIGKVTGTTLWAYKNDDDYIEALPAAMFATTDYARTNSTKTFMYQQGNFEAAITNDKTANQLDALNINYMGQTQFAGGLLDFTQDGVNLDGGETSVYCNEVWLKSSLWAAIMNLFLAVEKVPANEDGSNQLRTVMMDTIDTAIRNGTISKMKNLNTTQKIYIGNVTGDSEAWKQVYTEGFVLAITIEQNESGKYVAKYTLVYSKGDAIRKVEGSDILI